MPPTDTQQPRLVKAERGNEDAFTEVIKEALANLGTGQAMRVGRPGAAPVALDNYSIIRQLPEWLAQYDAGFHTATRTLYLAARDFQFGRGSFEAEYKQVQTQHQEMARQARAYREKEAELLRKVNEYKLRAANGHERKVDPVELTKELLGWPQVLDVLFGPAIDPITDKFIAPGTFVITFVPSAYLATDQGYGRGKFALTTPLRFVITEQGILMGASADADYAVPRANNRHLQTSYHPHMRGGDVCTGNLGPVFARMVQVNDVLSAVALLDEYTLSHRERDYMNRDWARESWVWWEGVMKGGFRKEEWHFDGRWDGKTIRLAKPGHPVMTWPQLYGTADLDEVLHVAGGLKHFSKRDVIDYQKSLRRAEEAKPCVACGRAMGTGCPCHGENCPGCNVVAWRCNCPPENGYAPLAYRLTVGQGVWQRCLPPEGRYECEKQMPGGRNCGQEALFRIIEGTPPRGYPHFVCRTHCPPSVWAAWQRAAQPDARQGEAERRERQNERLDLPTRRHLAGAVQCQYGREAAAPYGLCAVWAVEGYQQAPLRDWINAHPEGRNENAYRMFNWCAEHAPRIPVQVIRHDHEHRHEGLTDDEGAPLTHRHHHQHSVGDALTEAINQHADDHVAFQFPTGAQPRAAAHERIR